MYFGTECSKDALEVGLLELLRSHHKTHHSTEILTLIPKTIVLLAQNYDWANMTHCLISLILFDLCQPGMAITALGIQPAQLVFSLRISTLPSAAHLRYSVVLSKLHLNLELRLHSFRTQSWVSELPFWHLFFSWNAFEYGQHLCKNKIRCSHLKNTRLKIILHCIIFISSFCWDLGSPLLKSQYEEHNCFHHFSKSTEYSVHKSCFWTLT